MEEGQQHVSSNTKTDDIKERSYPMRLYSLTVCLVTILTALTVPAETIDAGCEGTTASSALNLAGDDTATMRGNGCLVIECFQCLHDYITACPGQTIYEETITAATIRAWLAQCLHGDFMEMMGAVDNTWVNYDIATGQLCNVSSSQAPIP